MCLHLGGPEVVIRQTVKQALEAMPLTVSSSEPPRWTALSVLPHTGSGRAVHPHEWEEDMTVLCLGTLPDSAPCNCFG